MISGIVAAIKPITKIIMKASKTVEEKSTILKYFTPSSAKKLVKYSVACGSKNVFIVKIQTDEIIEIIIVQMNENIVIYEI